MKREGNLWGRENYARWIVAASFLMIFTVLGFCGSVKGLYLAAVTEALNIKRGLYSINDSLRYITTAFINLFFGRLVLRYGVKKLVAAGFGALIASMLVYSFAEDIYMIFLGGVFLGLGIAWTGTTLVGYVVESWCKERKGTIMGAILAANGLGGALAAQIITRIIYDGGDGFGYRNAYRLTALILLVVGAIVVLVYKDAPDSDGSLASRKKKAKGASWSGITLQEAIHKPYFYGVAVCVFLTGMALQSVTGTSAAHLRDVGFSDDFIAIEVSVHAFALTAFKFLSGLSYDRFGLRKTMMFCCISGVTMMLILAFIHVGGAGNAMAMAYGVLSSAALPLETIMLPLIASDSFGRKEYPKFLGLLVSINTTGYAVGGPVANLCFDMIGTYKPILLAFSGVMMAIIIALQFVFRAVNRERRAVSEPEEE